MKAFQLWLDESGSFEDDTIKGRVCSFVGGVLIEQEKASEVRFGQLLPDSTLNHAMEMTMKQKKEYVIPALKKLKMDYATNFVFFENIAFKGKGNARELYLKLLSEGLLQLIQLLEAKFGSVKLDILIASRTAIDAKTNSYAHIKPEEYKRVFDKRFNDLLRQNQIIITPETVVDFKLRKASESNELTFADFASNIRREYHKKNVSGSTKTDCDWLFEDAYTFSLEAESSDRKIQALLAQNDISEALMEIYTGKISSTKSAYLHLVVHRMAFLNYRLKKSQFKQLASEILAYAARQEDYEMSIRFLELVHKELVPLLEKHDYPYEHFYMEIILQLADAYLRSDAIDDARLVLENGLLQISRSDKSLEAIFTYYRLLEKIAVFYINSYQFKKCSSLMESIRGIFEKVLRDLPSFDLISDYFDNIKSEYYGDVICMEIYALLFQKDADSELLTLLSDIALEQYPKFPGELERHRQYRSRIEILKGNYQPALHWLIAAAMEDGFFHQVVNHELITCFWSYVYEHETVESQKYYIMYYFLIIAKASQDDVDFAKVLYDSFIKHPISQLVLHKEGSHSKKDGGNLITAKDVDYHPKDIIYWKLADYLRSTNDWKRSLNYYDKAIAFYRKKKAIRLIPALAAHMSLELQHYQKSKYADKLLTYLEQLKTSFSAEISRLDFSETLTTLEQWDEQLRAIDICQPEAAQALWAFSQQWGY